MDPAVPKPFDCSLNRFALFPLIENVQHNLSGAKDDLPLGRRLTLSIWNELFIRLSDLFLIILTWRRSLPELDKAVSPGLRHVDG